MLIRGTSGQEDRWSSSPRSGSSSTPGRAHLALAEEIAEHLGVELGDPNAASSSRTARCAPGSRERVRGTDVFIIQTHAGTDEMSINDSIMEQLIMIDAAHRASAKRITAVCPFYGYARQDRKAEGREPITARLVADMFKAAGAKRMISRRPALRPDPGLLRRPGRPPHRHARCSSTTCASTRDDPVIVSPDAGRIKVAERFAQHLDADLAFIYKRRPKGMDNVAVARDVIGEVEGRQCVLIDDMIDTAGTIVVGGRDPHRARAPTDVWAMATHGVLSGPAIDRLKNSPIGRVVITNTLPLPPEKQIDKIEVLSVRRIIADALDAVFEDTSVSEIFGGENQA